MDYLHGLPTATLTAKDQPHCLATAAFIVKGQPHCLAAAFTVKDLYCLATTAHTVKYIPPLPSNSSLHSSQGQAPTANNNRLHNQVPASTA